MVRHLSMDNAVPAIFMVPRGGISGRAYISPRICRMYDKYDILLLHGCKYFRLVFKIAAIIGSYCLLCVIASAQITCMFVYIFVETLARIQVIWNSLLHIYWLLVFIVFNTLVIKLSWSYSALCVSAWRHLYKFIYSWQGNIIYKKTILRNKRF